MMEARAYRYDGSEEDFNSAADAEEAGYRRAGNCPL